jgi:membrane protein DedA with SNARE-associated domain
VFGALLDLVHQAVSSPWVYAALFGLAALDGFFPVVPGETAIVIAAVFAAGGGPRLGLVIGAGALGAFLGDHTPYLIGRVGLGPVGRRLRGGTRRRATLDWAGRRLDERGGSALVASRLVPGVRTGTTLAMGALGYPLPRFSAYDTVAAASWASYWGLLGFLGGATFTDQPIKGLLLALGAAAALAVVIEGSGVSILVPCPSPRPAKSPNPGGSTRPNRAARAAPIVVQGPTGEPGSFTTSARVSHVSAGRGWGVATSVKNGEALSTQRGIYMETPLRGNAPSAAASPHAATRRAPESRRRASPSLGGIDETGFVGDESGLHPVSHAESGEHAADVGLDRAFD